MRIVLTRETGRNDLLRTWLPRDCVVDEVPLTTTIYRDEREVQRELAADPYYGAFVALVVTSARATRYAPLLLAALAPGARILSVGPATSAAWSAAGVSVDVEADSRVADLARYVSAGPVLVAGAAGMREELVDDLAARDVASARCALYRTADVALDEAAVDKVARADVLFIGAPSAWRRARPHVSRTTWVVVPGSSTGEAVRREHERVLEGWSIALRERLANLEPGRST